jgi:hypothetical protein
LVDEFVECEVSGRHRPEIAIGNCRPAGVDDPLAAFPVCPGRIVCRRGSGSGVQSGPELVELAREVAVDRRDHKATSAAFRQKAILVQLLQGLMHGLAGDAEALCQVVLYDPRVWRHDAFADCLADRFVNCLANLLPRLNPVHFPC